MLAVLSNTFLRFYAIFSSNFKVFSRFGVIYQFAKNIPERAAGSARRMIDTDNAASTSSGSGASVIQTRQDKRARHDCLQGDTILDRGDGYVNIRQNGACARQATPPPVNTAAREKTIKAYASAGPVPRVNQSPAPKSSPVMPIFPPFSFSLFFFSYSF